MEDSDAFEVDLERATRWCRLRVDRPENVMLEMDDWCRKQFDRSSAFRFGKSFFFESPEDRMAFIMRWS